MSGNGSGASGLNRTPSIGAASGPVGRDLAGIRKQTNGRWRAEVQVGSLRPSATFDTKEQAKTWSDWRRAELRLARRVAKDASSAWTDVAKAAPTVGMIEAYLATKLRGAYRRRRSLFTLRLSELLAFHFRQNGRCAVSGAPLLYEGNGPFAATIDRVDSNSGYTAGNCRLVCHAINLLMNRWGDGVYAAFFAKATA